MPSFTVKTLGCKVNQYEAAAIRCILRNTGLTEHDGRSPLALVVVHTCCITSVAAQKCRQIIRRAARTSPRAHIAVTGCYAVAAAEAVRRLPGVTFLMGRHGDLTTQLTRLAYLIRNGHAKVPGWAGATLSNETIEPCSPSQVKGLTESSDVAQPSQLRPATVGLPPLDSFPGRHRALVKAQDGCDRMCSYCVVCRIRDRLWSRPAGEIAAEVRRLVAAGHGEIVLCGVNLGAYGRHTVHRARWSDDDDRLAALVDTVADAAGEARVRLSSLNPHHVTDALLGVMARRGNICPHLHVSLQSGSDAVLTRMNRGYTSEQFVDAVDRIRAALDAAALTTDVIVGFPGETDTDFEATLALARRAGFAKIHAFPFSPRPGTPATAWVADCPPGGIVRDRLARLARLEAELARTYRDQLVGRTADVLLEKAEGRENGVSVGITPRYQRVFISGPRTFRAGQRISVVLERADDRGLVGRLAESPYGET